MPLKFTLIAEMECHLLPGEMEFPSEIVKAVDVIWKEEKERRGSSLTDGVLFAIEEKKETRLGLKKCPYRFFVAKLRKPELFKNRPLRSLAISGMVRFENSVLFGLRSKSVTQFPGMWELVPSGGIAQDAMTKDGALSYQKQILAELKEELGIDQSAVLSVTPFLFIENTDLNHFDIGVEIRVRSLKTTQPRSNEYQEIKTVPLSSINEFLKTHQVIEASEGLLRQAGLL